MPKDYKIENGVPAELKDYVVDFNKITLDTLQEYFPNSVIRTSIHNSTVDDSRYICWEFYWEEKKIIVDFVMQQIRDGSVSDVKAQYSVQSMLKFILSGVEVYSSFHK